MKKEIKKLISESFNEALKSSSINESSDGNYMTEQDLNVIENSINSIRKNIDFESIPDWVKNSIAKLAGEITSLRDYYESGVQVKSGDNVYDEEEYELDLDDSLDSDEDDEEYELDLDDSLESDDEDDEDLEEGIGISHTMKRGMNSPRNK